MPDIAGWGRERLPQPPAGALFTLAPDWVCQTISPSTERIDRGSCGSNAREGVRHLWLLNPGPSTLEVYRLASEHWVLLATHEGDTSVRVEPYEAVEIDLKRLWGR